MIVYLHYTVNQPNLHARITCDVDGEQVEIVSIDAIEDGWIPVDYSRWPPWKTVAEILGGVPSDERKSELHLRFMRGALMAVKAGQRVYWP